jgi:hypothetical protein
VVDKEQGKETGDKKDQCADEYKYPGTEIYVGYFMCEHIHPRAFN